MNHPSTPPPAPDAPPTGGERSVLRWLLIAVSLAFVWVLLPFYGAVMWGVIVALLFTPVHRRLLARTRGRQTLAALLTLLLVILIVVIPFTLITASLAREAAAVFQRVQSGELNPTQMLRGLFQSMPGWTASLMERFGIGDFAALQAWLNNAVAQASKLLATRAVGIGQVTLDFVVELFVMLYLAYFLIRDGERVLLQIRRAIPLPAGDRDELLATFAGVVRATVKGNLVVAAAQGALGGLAFWYLDVRGALLWAVLMAFLSLLPAVGAGLVWLPVALYFIAIGSLWQGIALILYGVLVIGLVDNLLRPQLVGRDTRMPDYLVLVTTLGGLALIGINGFVIGPTVAAMFIAVWQLHLKRRGGG